jgi:hypothetical protein
MKLYDMMASVIFMVEDTVQNAEKRMVSSNARIVQTGECSNAQNVFYLPMKTSHCIVLRYVV